MDTKRTVIAVVLSLAVLFGWQFIFPPPPSTQQPAPAEPAKAAPAPAAQAKAMPAFAPTPGRNVTVRTPLYTAVFNSNGGVLESFVLDKYRDSIKPQARNIEMIGDTGKLKAPLGLIINGTPTWVQGQWSFDGADLALEGAERKTLIFTGEAAGLRIERRLTFSADSYLVGEETALSNVSADQAQLRLDYTAATAGLSQGEDDKYNPTRVAYHGPTVGFTEVTSKDDLEKEGHSLAPSALNWAAIDSNYFIFAVLPEAETVTLKAGHQDGAYRLALEETASLGAGETRTSKVSYFLGPMDRGILAAMPRELAKAVDFGWFTVVAEPLLVLLNWLYSFVGNYGVAIILLTVLIKAAFWPLTQKSMKSMEQMKKLQPMMQKLREKHGDDKQKLNEEIMRLYKTYKVNPLGGCLPMLIQIPVFFGLYKALLGAIELRQAPFISHLPFTDMIWLADLSAKDPYYLTPLVMGASWFLQQKMSPPPGDPTQAKIMLFMPIVFTFVFLGMPSGLVVYWLMNNVLSIGQQWLVMRGKKA